jgi:hypothetical protein
MMITFVEAGDLTYGTERVTDAAEPTTAVDRPIDEVSPRGNDARRVRPTASMSANSTR